MKFVLLMDPEIQRKKISVTILTYRLTDWIMHIASLDKYSTIKKSIINYVPCLMFMYPPSLVMLSKIISLNISAKIPAFHDFVLN